MHGGSGGHHGGGGGGYGHSGYGHGGSSASGHGVTLGSVLGIGGHHGGHGAGAAGLHQNLGNNTLSGLQPDKDGFTGKILNANLAQNGALWFGLFGVLILWLFVIHYIHMRDEPNHVVSIETWNQQIKSANPRSSGNGLEAGMGMGPGIAPSSSPQSGFSSAITQSMFPSMTPSQALPQAPTLPGNGPATLAPTATVPASFGSPEPSSQPSMPASPAPASNRIFSARVDSNLVPAQYPAAGLATGGATGGSLRLFSARGGSAPTGIGSNAPAVANALTSADRMMMPIRNLGSTTRNVVVVNR